LDLYPFCWNVSGRALEHGYFGVASRGFRGAEIRETTRAQNSSIPATRFLRAQKSSAKIAPRRAYYLIRLEKFVSIASLAAVSHLFAPLNGACGNRRRPSG
jgi:hypothetical protein